MKVLIINVVCGIKSTGRICTDIADELVRKGHIVKIAYGRELVPDEYKKYAVKIGNEADIYMHALMSRLTDSAGFHSTFYTRRFIKWIKVYNPDVIHIHNIHGYYINVKILFSYLRSCGKRILWTLHDCWSFTGHSALCDGDQCEKWKYGCGSCPQKNIYPKSLIDRSRANWEKKEKIFTGIPNLTIVTPSKWLENNVKKSFLSGYSTTVINNGIDVEKFHPSDTIAFRKKYGLEDKYIILGVAAVWSYKKGYSDFIQLSTMLDNSYKIVLVGVEDKLLTDKYDNLLTIGLTMNIRELTDIYSSADIFVNLTYCDSYPTVNLEARSCGLPIITYDTGGSPDAAGDDAYAIVSRGDINAIADCVKKLKNERGRCEHNVSTNNLELLSNKRALNKYIEMILKK